MKKLTLRIACLILAVLLLTGCADVNRITGMLADLNSHLLKKWNTPARI